MEIYEQVAVSGQLLILLKSVLLLMVLFLVGHCLLPKSSDNLPLSVANSVATALIVSSALFATVHTAGRSFLLPLVIYAGLVGVMVWKAAGFRQPGLKKILSLEGACWLLAFVLLFVLNSLTTQPFDAQGIVVINPDISLYANWARHLMESGRETLPQDLLTAKSMQSFYHFIDLWFVGWGAAAFHINIYVFYALVYKPLLQFTLVAFVVGFARLLGLSRGLQALSCLTLFTTALYPFRDASPARWYLDLSATSYPLYHYIGTYFVAVDFFLILSAFWFYRRPDVAIILLSMLGLINPLFIPVVPLFLALVLTIYGLRKRFAWLTPANVVAEGDRRAYLLAFAISVLLFVFFKLFIIGDASEGALDLFRLKTYLVAFNVLARKVFVSLVYFPICVAGYVFLIKRCPAYRTVALLFLYLFVAGIVFMSLVFETIQGNIIQVPAILWNFPLVTLGSLGFLLMIRESERYRRLLLVLFLINALWGVYNTFSEKNSTFHPIYRFNHAGETIAYEDIDTLSEIVRTHGERGGYFLKPDQQTRNLNVTDFVTYNAFTSSYSNSYRLSAIEFDHYHKEANRVYKNTLVYSLNEDPTVGNKPLAIVEKMNVRWLVVDDQHYYLPDELKSLFEKKYELSGFRIFARRR